MRMCSKCSLSYEDYGQRCSYCKICKREYDREYHSNRSESSKLTKQLKQKERVKIAKQFIFNFLKKNPCSICGESDPVVLEFDHLDREDKLSNVSEMTTLSLSKINAEIDKCRILCANCHRRHTAKQMGWYKDLE